MLILKFKNQFISSKFLHRFFVSSWICLIICSLSSCDKNRLFEENQQIAGYSWKYEDVKTFTAEIPDTSQKYNIIINVRHSFNYGWRNFWVNIETVFPDGRKFEKRVNLVLSQPDGHWFGNCLGDNCDIQIPIQEKAYFPVSGKYIFKLKQDMRVNPLDLIKSIGLRIEKTQEQE